MNINNNFSYGKVSTNTDYKESVNQSDLKETGLNLSDLKSGSSFTGHVVSINGDSVKLKLPGNTIVDAHISGAIDLKEGSDVTFEVRQSGSSISISPLYTNLSSNPTITKALTAAGLPVTTDTLQMTGEMMKAGMGIDKSSLSSMFREISFYPSADAGSIVELHRLGLNVTEENLSQLENYKNLSYKLEEGMEQVTSDLNSLIDELSENGEGEKAATVFKALITVASDSSASSADGNSQALGNSPVVQDNGGLVNDTLIKNGSPADTQNAESVPVKENADTAALPALDSADGTAAPAQSAALETTPETASESAFEKAMRLLSEINGNNEAVASDNTNAASFEISDLQSVLSQIDESISKGDSGKLSSLLENKELRQFVLDTVSSKWEISPADVADKENVKELYNKLQRDLGIIEKAINETGAEGSKAAMSSGNMSSNLDFLNQVNQLYSFVQLPLKLSGGENAHGDLYVYSGGRKMSADNSKITALLHLDMEHLGPLDVYVSLDTSGYDKKLSTNFTVSDDSVLDFLESHMDELNKRLEEKGYSCSTKMSVKNNSDTSDSSDGQNNGAMGPVFDMTDSMKLSEYSFDVRT